MISTTAQEERVLQHIASACHMNIDQDISKLHLLSDECANAIREFQVLHGTVHVQEEPQLKSSSPSSPFIDHHPKDPTNTAQFFVSVQNDTVVTQQNDNSFYSMTIVCNIVVLWYLVLEWYFRWDDPTIKDTTTTGCDCRFGDLDVKDSRWTNDATNTKETRLRRQQRQQQDANWHSRESFVVSDDDDDQHHHIKVYMGVPVHLV
jgi:hypothetical protein